VTTTSSTTDPAAEQRADRSEQQEVRARVGRSSTLKARLVTLGLLVLAVLWVGFSNDFGPTTGGALVALLGTALIYAVAATGLNLQYGHGGLLNFGFVAFMAVGAYVTVLLIPHAAGPTSERSEGVVPLVVAVLVAMAASALLGLLFSIPAIKLRSDYLAIVMLAVAEILRLSLRNAEGITGGVYGVLSFTTALQDLRPAFVDSIADALMVQEYQLWTVIVSGSCLVLCTLLVAGLMRTPWGMLLRAVSDDEDAVRALGKNPVRIKLQTLTLGGAIGGLAGALMAFQLTQVNPDIFPAQVTFFIFTITILGGAGSVWGPAIGSALFWTLMTQTGVFISDHVGSNSVSAASRFIMVGLLMIAIIVIRPQGLLGRRENVDLHLR
jgi:neutral amino acid transport system permease protein